MERTIYFDGVCNLCSSSVQFILQRDKNEVFRFASLQSAHGANALQSSGLPTHDLQSVVLQEGDNWYSRSTAALRIARQLNGAWPLLYGFIVVPKFIRDAVYNLIARYRYVWFGKKEACWLPLPKWRHRFIDQAELHA